MPATLLLQEFGLVKNLPQALPKKILVTYASRGDSTAGVVDAIGKTLAERGLDVEVCPMKEVYDLTPY